MNPRLTAFVLSLPAITGAFAQPRGLEPEPLAAEAIGLRMYLPAGSVVTTQAVDQTISYLASDPGATWSLRISTLTPAVAQPTAQALAEQHLQAIQATGRRFQVIANEPRMVGAFLGHLLYIQQVFDDDKQLVNGWLILPNSARSFVVLTILTTADQFLRLRPVLDASFDSIELRTIDDRLTQRQARLLRGRALIGTLTPEKLRSVLSERRWYRIYRPGGSDRIADDTEIGFLSIECTEAMRGQLTPERQPRSFSGMETQLGLMVLVEARAIIDGERSHYLDVDGRYWLAWDRFAEAWSIRQTQRMGQAARTTAETGIRDRLTLDIIHSSKEQLTREPSRYTIPDLAYLSQAEVFLLGQLLPRDGSITGPMSFYFYDTKSRRLGDRIDDWQSSRDGSGQWVLKTLPVLETKPIVQHFDAQGRRIRRIDGDGTVTERIDPNELRAIWRTKGLMGRRQ